MVLLPELFVPQRTVIGLSSKSLSSLKDLKFLRLIFLSMNFINILGESVFYISIIVKQSILGEEINVKAGWQPEDS